MITKKQKFLLDPSGNTLCVLLLVYMCAAGLSLASNMAGLVCSLLAVSFLPVSFILISIVKTYVYKNYTRKLDITSSGVYEIKKRC